MDTTSYYQRGNAKWGMENLSSGLNNISLIATNVLMVWPGGKKGPLSFKMLQINLYYLNDTYSSASLSLSHINAEKEKETNKPL